MRMLSTGAKSTLGNYLALTEAVFGRTSPAANYLRVKIAETPMGAEEEVIADEGQMIMLLSNVHLQESTAVVPLMPTPEMLDAGHTLVSGSLTYAETRQVYEAMVKAAPVPAQTAAKPLDEAVTALRAAAEFLRRPAGSGIPTLELVEAAIAAAEAELGRPTGQAVVDAVPPQVATEPSLQEAEDAIRAFEDSNWHGSRGYHSGLLAAADMLCKMRDQSRQAKEVSHD